MDYFFQRDCIEEEEDIWQSLYSKKEESETDSSAGFECNICLDVVRDPVVTLCGHLYCWPCIFRWINNQSIYPENPDDPKITCPVCKAEISNETLVPLYGRGQNSPKDTASDVDVDIPKRPSSPSCGDATSFPNITNPYYERLRNEGPRRRYQSIDPPPPPPVVNIGGSSSSLADPMIGMLGDMIYSRMVGNSDTSLYTYPNSYRLASSGSPRLRRQMRQADKSLGRICFFLCCCVMLCLILF